MMILGSPEEQGIPVGFITFEELPEKKAPVLIEAKPDWSKYIPWIIFGIALLLPPSEKKETQK